jgi:hypothetical protein
MGDLENIVWGTALDLENIVWGTALDLENIVWGTSGGVEDAPMYDDPAGTIPDYDDHYEDPPGELEETVTSTTTSLLGGGL